MKTGWRVRLANSTAAQFVALYLGLNLLAAIPVFAFIYQMTNQLVIEELRESVEDQTRLLRSDYRAGGFVRVQEAVQEHVASSAGAHAALLLTDAQGRARAGNLGAWPPTLGHSTVWREMRLYRTGHDRPEWIGLVATRFPDGNRLIVGRVVEDRARLREALAMALFGALLIGLPIGLVGSFILLRFMNRRVRAISDVAATVAAGDLRARIVAHQSQDPFDQLAMSLNATFERVESLVNELRFVTDSLAHDLRSPLTRMRASLERAIARKGDAACFEALDAVSRDIQVLLRMLSTTLEVSRAEAGIGRESFEPFDLAALTRDLCEMYQPLAEEHDIEMSVVAPQTLTIMGNRELLGQATSNLVDNALKYGAGSIRLSIQSSPGHVRLAVADRGPGIPPEQRKQALARYRRLDAARSAEGSGLGLSLVGAVARLHGGTIGLEDNEPGLRVVITLPSTQSGGLSSNAP